MTMTEWPSLEFPSVVRVLTEDDVKALWRIMQESNKPVGVYHEACLIATVRKLLADSRDANEAAPNVKEEV